MQKILIVEDDIDIQELLRNFLQEVGYEISIANDGMEAISLFSTIHFDLILLDIMLPKIDGFTVCELIRKQSQIPRPLYRQNYFRTAQYNIQFEKHRQRGIVFNPILKNTGRSNLIAPYF